MIIKQFTPLLLLLTLVVMWPAGVNAQEEGKQQDAAQPKSDYKAVTTADPAIPTDYLDLRLDPLTKAELEAEMHAWRDLVKDIATRIAQEEIQTRQQNEAIADKEEQQEGEADVADEEAQKERLLDDLTTLREKKVHCLSAWTSLFTPLRKRAAMVKR